jgi:outer membrane protein assembly factor BamA
VKNKIILFLSTIFLCTAFVLQDIESFAQQKIELNIQLVDSNHNAEFNRIKKQIVPKKNFQDTLTCNRALQEILLNLNSSGYLAAAFDSVQYILKECNTKLFLGEKYEWVSLSKGNVDDGFMNGTGFRQRLFTGKSFQFEQVRKLQEKILVNCQNNGYPFAAIKLDSIQFTDHLISAKLNLSKNQFIKFDSVVVKGNSTIAPAYIYNYIGIKRGDVYNEALVNRISSRIRELAFVREKSPNRVLFSEKEKKLELYLENKKASQFDGIIGIAPDQAKPDKYVLTGEAHLKLQNALSRGEIMELAWKQLPVQSQDLKLHLLYPYIFNTPFGIDANLALFKKDTTYVEVTENLGLLYQLKGNNYVKVFINDKTSTVEASLAGSTVLPDYANVSSLSYGLGIHYEKLDYRLNPRTGYSFEATGSTGTRTISKIQELPDSLYNNLKLKTTEYHLEFTIDYFIPITGRQVLNIGTKGAYLYSPDIFTNELYRFGGLKTLRGFDEESILASAYIIGKVEYRYILEQNSYLFAFFNEASYRNTSNNNYIHDTPFGFGTGITFDTKIGIMSVSYALGKQFDNPIYFRDGKIHFGILNYF